MRDFFGPGGSLALSAPGFESRPEQGELAAAVAEALAGRRHLVAEAGTGTGKSLAYLVPALESGRRVVVATATKALQEQLLGSDIPKAASALDRELRVAVLKGRQNYVCRRGAQGFELLGGALFGRVGDATAYERLRPWLETTQTGDRAELDFEPPDAVWTELAVGPDRCHGRRCPFLGVCFSEAARARAAAADLVIANHALYFADLGLRDRADGTGVLPDHDAVVFDEAHRLEDAAAAWLGGRVSAYGLERLARDADRACRERGVAAPARALDRLNRDARSFVAATTPAAGRRRLREPPTAAGEALERSLTELALALRGQGDELDQLSRRALEVARDLGAILDPNLDRVVWAEPGVVAWAPVDVSETLRELLWDAGPTAVLVSATTTAGDDSSFLRRRLGLDDAVDLRLESPFDFREQALLYLPPRLPDPRSPEAFDSAAEEIVALCRISGGRALVLTTSYRALDGLAARIRGRLPHEILVQGEAPRERLLERFRAEVDSVLVATATFWQGIDVRGEALSLLVIDKLPFPAPGDPVTEARGERIVADGGDAFRDYLLPAAVLQLRQGFGRLIRSHLDRGVVAILDPRVRTRAYGRAFLEALPPCRVTTERGAVADFFAEGALLTA